MKRVISCGVDSPNSVAENSHILLISSKVIQGVCVAVLLASCATVPPPESKVVTKNIYVPVPVKCVDPASIPPEPGTVAMPIDARLAADLAASQARDLRKWGRGLMALIGPCTK